ncbi:MAG: M20/M25/M40 family metallo-hydrolase [Candidatus Kapabacteria bacterium]|nr:M20/M25/M40 family metallo-hydrolase [Candidatus Kapabacteria bacterium]
MNASFLRILVLSVFATQAALAQLALPTDAVRHFAPESFRPHLSYLASDEMRGRDTPSPELERAADYIAAHFKKIGLEPLGKDYRLPFALVTPDLDPSAQQTYLTVTKDGQQKQLTLSKEFAPLEQTAGISITNRAVSFVGFGITAPEYGYDDYKDIDVRGHVVLMLRGEPESADTSKFRGAAFTIHASNREKIRRAIKNGAVGVLLVDAVRALRKPIVSGYAWPSLSTKPGRSGRSVQLPSARRDSAVVMSVGESVVDLLIGSVDSLRALTKALDATLSPRSTRLANLTVTAAVKLTSDTFNVSNVGGILRGSELPDEYVVMGAHYDHVGVGRPNDAGDSIYNGADDNASGTTSLMVAAEALAGSSTRPARSVVFLAFAAEEKGLLGSRAYVAASPLPVDKCVAMINTDMIGRCENGKLSIGGAERCPDLIALNEAENAKLAKPFNLAYDIEQYFFRSDQASFAMKRIPVIFYFTGEHKDYHKVTDEIPLIDFTSLAGISRLATTVLWRAAHMPRTTYVPAGFEE